MLLGVTPAFVTARAMSERQHGLVYPPDELVAGATLGEWGARHWQWTLSFPVGINPGQDVSGATCGYGQSGPVFFIPRNFPPCAVPSGAALFVPIAGTVCSTAEPPPFAGRSAAELRACAAAEVDRYTGIVVRVDGEPVPEIASHRVASPPFPLLLPEHNVLGASPGMAVAVADGYQLLLAPLPVGTHEIVAHVELTDGTVLPDKVLHLTVVVPPELEPEASPLPGTPVSSPVP
jgi:hypothetical protein